MIKKLKHSIQMGYGITKSMGALGIPEIRYKRIMDNV